MYSSNTPVLVNTAGAPFAIGLLCMNKPSKRSFVVAGLTGLVWPMSFWAAVSMGSIHVPTYIALCTAGCLGAVTIGVIQCIAFQLINPGKELLGIALAGAVPAIFFKPTEGDKQRTWELISAFVAWQTVVGSTLHWFTYRGAAMGKRLGR